MKIWAIFKIFTKWIKFALLFTLILKLIFKTFFSLRALLLLILLLLIGELLFLTLTLRLWLLLHNLCLLFCRLVLLFRLFSALFSLLTFFLVLLCLLPQFLSPGCNKLINFLFLDLLLILLSSFSCLEFLRLSLPFDDLIGNNVDGIRVVNACWDVVLELSGVALPIEVRIEEYSEISEWGKTYSSFSFSKVSLCLISRVRMKSSTMKLGFSIWIILKEINQFIYFSVNI